jgi:uncharacterized protein YjiS (DUF1127 family)
MFLLHFIDLARRAISAFKTIRELDAISNQELDRMGISRLEMQYTARSTVTQNYKEEI